LNSNIWLRPAGKGKPHTGIACCSSIPKILVKWLQKEFLGYLEGKSVGALDAIFILAGVPIPIFLEHHAESFFFVAREVAHKCQLPVFVIEMRVPVVTLVVNKLTVLTQKSILGENFGLPVLAITFHISDALQLAIAEEKDA
jgi:hypothetical protein